MFDYHRIYIKNLTSGFSNFLRQEWIWLFKIPLNKVKNCVRVEFSELSSYGRVLKTEDFYWPVLRVKSDSVGKILLIFKMYYKPFLSCLWYTHCFSQRWAILPHPLKASFKNAIIKLGRLKGHDKKFQIP